MTLQFNPAAYTRAYEIGQQNEYANKMRPFEILAQLPQQTGQLADTINDIRKERRENMPLEQIINGMSSRNRISDPIAPPVPTTPTPMQQQAFATTPTPDQSYETESPVALPGRNMIENFTDWRKGMSKPAAIPQPDRYAQAGLPDVYRNMNIRQLGTLAKAKELFPAPKAPENKWSYTGTTTEGYPVAMDVGTGEFKQGNLPMGVKMQPKTAGATGVTTANISWETATPAQQRMAEQMVKGNIRASDLGMRDRATIVTLANEYANANGLPFQSYRGDVNARTEQYFTTGKGGQTATSLNLALSHLDGVMNAYENLKNTDVALLNRPINWLRENTDNTEVVALGNKLTALQGELATVFKGSAGTDQEIGHWMRYLSDELTPEQAVAAGEAIDELLRSRLHGLNYQQSSSLGGGGRERKLLSPEAEQIAARYEEKAQVPAISSQKQYDRLPKGARYSWNGKVMVKK